MRIETVIESAHRRGPRAFADTLLHRLIAVSWLVRIRLGPFLNLTFVFGVPGMGEISAHYAQN